MLVPVGTLQAFSVLIQDQPWYTVSESLPGERSQHSAAKELLHWHREAEFKQSHIGCWISLINLPTSENSLVEVSWIDPVEDPEARGPAVLPGAITQVELSFPGAYGQVEFGQAGGVDGGIAPDIAVVIGEASVEPNPERGWTPWTEALSNDAAPTKMPPSDQSICCPPPPDPPPSREQLRQKLDTGITQTLVAHKSLKQNSKLPVSGRIIDAMDPADVANIEHWLVVEQKVSIEIIER